MQSPSHRTYSFHAFKNDIYVRLSDKFSRLVVNLFARFIVFCGFLGFTKYTQSTDRANHYRRAV